MLDRWSQGRQAIVTGLHVVCFGPQRAPPARIAHVKAPPGPCLCRAGVLVKARVWGEGKEGCTHGGSCWKEFCSPLPSQRWGETAQLNAWDPQRLSSGL